MACVLLSGQPITAWGNVFLARLEHILLITTVLLQDMNMMGTGITFAPHVQLALIQVWE